MLQLQNKTPFAANLSLMPNEQGVDTLYVMVSATFKWDQRWILAEEQLPPTEADQYSGEPGVSSIIKPSEYHLGKVASDIIVIGDACAPEGQQVRALDVSVQVGQIAKSVRVFGDRVWQNGQISQPELFERMPITYEHAYGGICVDENNAVISAEERNPVGLGHLGKYHKSQFENTLLPNIEDPNDLIQDLKDQPEPAGFGAIAPNWRPRLAYAGTYDDNWTQTRAPYMPHDFDKRFFNCAPPGLIYPGFLQGGESISVSGMHPLGAINVQLPWVNLLARARIGDTVQSLDFNLETLIVGPNDMTINIAWRASIKAPKNIAQLKEVELLLGRNAQAA